MDIRSLREFITVVQEEGISAASDVLRISQPALSRRMKELEKELDTTLFARGNRGRTISLTEEGRLFYRRAQEIVELADRARDEMHQHAELEGTIHIAAAQSSVMRYIGRAATRIRIRYPRILFDMHDGNGLDNTERLNNGLADFGVLIEPIDMSKFDHLPLPGGDSFGILMRADDALASCERITPQQLETLPLVVSKGSIARRDLSGWYSGEGRHHLNIIGTMNLIYNMSCFVREGYGYALTNGGLIDTSEQSGLVYRPLDPPLTTRLSIAWRKDRELPAIAQVFLDQLREVVVEDA